MKLFNTEPRLQFGRGQYMGDDIGGVRDKKEKPWREQQKGKSWTEYYREDINRLYDEGKSFEEIAEILGLSSPRIARRIWGTESKPMFAETEWSLSTDDVWEMINNHLGFKSGSVFSFNYLCEDEGIMPRWSWHLPGMRKYGVEFAEEHLLNQLTIMVDFGRLEFIQDEGAYLVL